MHTRPYTMPEKGRQVHTKHTEIATINTEDKASHDVQTLKRQIESGNPDYTQKKTKLHGVQKVFTNTPSVILANPV
eukprot:c43581_g1_i1 orf=252-479(-)